MLISVTSLLYTELKKTVGNGSSFWDIWEIRGLIFLSLLLQVVLVVLGVGYVNSPETALDQDSTTTIAATTISWNLGTDNAKVAKVQKWEMIKPVKKSACDDVAELQMMMRINNEAMEVKTTFGAANLEDQIKKSG